jgi:hypothetical protein
MWYLEYLIFLLLGLLFETENRASSSETLSNFYKTRGVTSPKIVLFRLKHASTVSLSQCTWISSQAALNMRHDYRKVVPVVQTALNMRHDHREVVPVAQAALNMRHDHRKVVPVAAEAVPPFSLTSSSALCTISDTVSVAF